MPLRWALMMQCSSLTRLWWLLIWGDGPARAELERVFDPARVVFTGYLGGVDLACFGRQAIDDDSGTTAAQAARLLGWPALTLASVIKVDGSSLRVERAIEEGRQVVTAKMPAVVSLVRDIGEPRYPSFMGIRRASKAEIPTWSLSQIGIPAPMPVVEYLSLVDAPVREVVCEMVTGANPKEIAEHLADKILGEKLL